MLKQRKKQLSSIFRIIDVLIILISFYAVYYYCCGPMWVNVFDLPKEYQIFLFTCFIGWIYLSERFQLYESGRMFLIRREAWDVCKITTLCLIIATIPPFFIHDNLLSRTFLLILWPLQTIALILPRFILREWHRYARRKGYTFREILIVGRNDRSAGLVREIEELPELGIRILGFIDAPNAQPDVVSIGEYKVIGSLDSLEAILRDNVVDEVFVFLPIKSFYSEIEEIVRFCENIGIEVKIPTDLFSLKLARLTISLYGNIPLIGLYTGPKMDGRLVVKRLIDMVISAILLVILSPLFLLIGVLIKGTSRGPIFFRWKVVGRNNRDFTGYKFRTMLSNADELKETLMAQNEMSGPVFKIKNDPRITPVGKWLRKFSLDELPQLWSVLKGDMSLVGPRPPSRKELEGFNLWQRRKISLKPGLTCLWQVNGRNGISDFSEWCRLDLEYIDNWSLGLDLKILLKTAWVVFRGTGY